MWVCCSIIMHWNTKVKSKKKKAIKENFVEQRFLIWVDGQWQDLNWWSTLCQRSKKENTHKTVLTSCHNNEIEREKKRGNLGRSSDINFFFCVMVGAHYPLCRYRGDTASRIYVNRCTLMQSRRRKRGHSEQRERKIWEGRRDAVGRPDILGFESLQRRGNVTSLGQTHLSKSERVS